MEELFVIITKHTIIVINSMALVIIVIGTIEAFVVGLRAMLRPEVQAQRFRTSWVRYARWLVAGLICDTLEPGIEPSVDRQAALTAS